MTRFIRKASQAMEFALLFPVLIVVVSGIADYGWYLSQHVGVSEAARAGARAASTAWVDEDPVLLAEAAAIDVLARWNIEGGVVSVEMHQDVVLGQVVSVDVSVPYDPLLHLLPVPEVLSQAVEMRTEWQPPPES